MNQRPSLAGPIALIFVAILIVVGLLVGGAFGCNAYSRYQKRADANNKVKTNHIKIRFFEQQKRIEQQKADIRVIHAIGIRKAQDHIAATLTPLYVSFEQVQALKEIATRGQNNSVVFVPTQPGTGLPIVPGLTEKVGK
jgi:hypothetical protein